MDGAVKRAEEAFENFKSEMFQVVLSEIYEASKAYDDATKNDQDFMTVIDRNSRANMIAINEAKDSLDLLDPNSIERLKRLLVKQTIYNTLKEEFIEEKVSTK